MLLRLFIFKLKLLLIQVSISFVLHFRLNHNLRSSLIAFSYASNDGHDDFKLKADNLKQFDVADDVITVVAQAKV